MKQNLKLAVALLAGIAIGGAALNGLHAQAKPPAISIAQLIELRDQAVFKEFAKRNAAGMKAAGGHFLAARGRVVGVNGMPPKAAGMVTWDSLDQAAAYFSSTSYKELIPLRDKGANTRVFIVEGLAK
jgi:uncharacterized protein (DUF1330 family)